MAKYTDEQTRGWAEAVVRSDVADPDFMGVAEQHGDDWDELGLTDDEFRELHLRVHDLACSAHVIVTWDPARYRALERLAARNGVAFMGLLDEERSKDGADTDGGDAA